MRHLRWTASLVVAGVLLTPTLAHGAGFALFEHGARGVAMAGAYGAVADDPTAIYYNPAGMAFLKGTQTAAGAYIIQPKSKFEGANPYPGAGYSANQENQLYYPPHLYFTSGITDSVRWGVGIYAPFGLGTWWANDFAGRFISKRVNLTVANINPNVSFKLSDNLAFAVGADYFISTVHLTKSIGVINPYTQRVAEVGQVHLKAADQTGLGWNAALLGKFEGGVSVGVSYRSKVKVDYSGKASFLQFSTGYPDFDQIVAKQIPFGTAPGGKTKIEYPSEARVGIALTNGPTTLSADWVRLGWSSFKELPIEIVGYPLLSSTRKENYKDTDTYRLGFEYRSSDTFAFQAGALYDRTPVPTESVSPLLADSDRTGVSVGFSYHMSPKTRFDLGYLHLMFKKRSTEGQDADNFNGTYKNSAELLGFSVIYKF